MSLDTDVQNQHEDCDHSDNTFLKTWKSKIESDDNLMYIPARCNACGERVRVIFRQEQVEDSDGNVTYEF